MPQHTRNSTAHGLPVRLRVHLRIVGVVQCAVRGHPEERLELHTEWVAAGQEILIDVQEPRQRTPQQKSVADEVHVGGGEAQRQQGVHPVAQPAGELLLPDVGGAGGLCCRAGRASAAHGQRDAVAHRRAAAPGVCPNLRVLDLDLTGNHFHRVHCDACPHTREPCAPPSARCGGRPHIVERRGLEPALALQVCTTGYRNNYVAQRSRGLAQRALAVSVRSASPAAAAGCVIPAPIKPGQTNDAKLGTEKEVTEPRRRPRRCHSGQQRAARRHAQQETQRTPLCVVDSHHDVLLMPLVEGIRGQ